MRQLVLDRKIFFPASAFVTAIVIFFSMQQIVRSAYDSYWVAIDRVQTVDFNILASTSTGTVSEIIKTGNVSKANEFVASNYCLFRIKIESCKDPECRERLVVADNAQQESNRCRALADESKTALVIPIFQETTAPASVSFENAYASEPTLTDRAADPIGFLSLSRGNVVPFDVDYESFISKWLKGEANASRHDIYKTAAWVSILLGIFTFMLLFVARQFYISHLKRKAITEKLVKLIDQKINKVGR